MAEGAATSAESLEWPNKDNRKFLHAVFRVGDLERTIKFYTECFGMKVLRQRDIPEEKYSNAFLGFGPETSHFVFELTYNYGVDKYDIGTGFGHFAIATQDVYKLVENIRAKGGDITREPGPVKGGSTVIAFVKDPDGYMFELIQRGPTPEPLCQVMLRIGDMERSIKFYEKALGMKLLKKTDRPEQKYTIAMMGYGPELESAVLELTYNYGVTEYTKGNAYAQVAISTNDVYKSGEAVNLVIQELGGEITKQPGPVPGIGTKIVAFLDPDGWKNGTISFGFGFFCVVMGWPIVGMILEAYGFIVRFSGFWPTLSVFVLKIPVLGWIFQLPFIRSFLDRYRGKRVPV